MKNLLFFIALAVGSLRAQHVQVSWTPGANDTGFNIYRSSQICPAELPANVPIGSFFRVGTAGEGVTSFYDVSSMQGIPYCYFVTGTNAGLESARSNAVSVTIPVTTPTDVPTNVSATVVQ